MRYIFALLIFLQALPALAQSVLTPWASLPQSFRSQISNDGLFVKGVGVNTWYALEVDPATGELPVTGSFTFSGLLAEDHNYGTVGANTLRTAAQIGNATGAADFGSGTVSAQTLRVVLPTNQPAIPTNSAGRAVLKTFTQSYSSSNVLTSAFTTVISSTGATVNELDIYDTSGGDYYLAYAATCGALSTTSNAIIVSPGGGGKDFAIPSGNCIGIQAKTANLTTGSVNMTFYE